MLTNDERKRLLNYSQSLIDVDGDMKVLNQDERHDYERLRAKLRNRQREVDGLVRKC